MDIEEELKTLDRSRAIRIAANILKHFGGDLQKLVIACVHRDTIGVAKGRDPSVLEERPDFMASDLEGEPAEIMLMAEPDPEQYPDNVLKYSDEGCDFGKCEECDVLLTSSYKQVLCPLCGAKTYLT